MADFDAGAAALVLPLIDLADLGDALAALDGAGPIANTDC